ncbi:MAG: hypothetical protein PVJ02_18450, partial [Gemmatimonadota bacterium]
MVEGLLKEEERLVGVPRAAVMTVGGGGVRWYELTVDSTRALRVRQQGTYAPGRLYRWMGSPAMDALGNIGIGYSFGGT